VHPPFAKRALRAPFAWYLIPRKQGHHRGRPHVPPVRASAPPLTPIAHRCRPIGVQLWPRILADIETGPPATEIRRSVRHGLSRRSAGPRRFDSPGAPAPHHHDSDRDARLPQPLAAFAISPPTAFACRTVMRESPQDRRRIFSPKTSATPSHRQQPRSNPNICALPSATPSSRSTKSGAAAVRPPSDVTERIQTLIRAMAIAGCTGVFVGFESLTDDTSAAAERNSPKTAEICRRVRMLHEPRHSSSNGSFVLGFDHDRRSVLRPDPRSELGPVRNRTSSGAATFHHLSLHSRSRRLSSPNASRRTPAPPRLVSLRHRPRRLSVRNT